LMPRLVHQIVKIPNKGTSNWQYSWVPIIGPLMGSMLAVAFYELILVAI
jgi:glycerol uptake facilitator protein